MTDANEPPHLDVDVRPDHYQDDFGQVLNLIRPKWKLDEVVYKKNAIDVSQGLLNVMVRVFERDDDARDDVIMLRILNTKISMWIDRSAEVICIKHLHKLDCAPQILASFKTGFCYQFIKGEVLRPPRLVEEPIWRSIAEELAKIHSAEIVDEKSLKRESSLRDLMTKFWAGYPNELKDPKRNEIFQKKIPPKDILENEIESALAHALSFDPDLVLCHNDTRPENVVWNPETQVAKFVDFEGISYNYRSAELAAHFERYAGLAAPDYSLIPDDDFQQKWIRVYLEKYNEVKGKSRESVTDEDVRKLFVQVKKFRLFYLILGSLAGPVMENAALVENDQLDMLGFSIAGLKEYYKFKDELMMLR